jgi:hypothetical protein
VNVVDNPLKTLGTKENEDKDSETKSIGQQSINVGQTGSNAHEITLAHKDSNLSFKQDPSPSSLSFQPVSKYTRQLMEQPNFKFPSALNNEEPTKLSPYPTASKPFNYQNQGNFLSLKDTINQQKNAPEAPSFQGSVMSSASLR